MEDEENTRRVRELNDQLRRTGQGGQIVLTPGIIALGMAAVIRVVAMIATFDDFSVENDPYGEHDFGSVRVDGNPILWKIDYYDLELKYHSPDKADPAVTTRVLTIMRSDEY